MSDTDADAERAAGRDPAPGGGWTPPGGVNQPQPGGAWTPPQGEPGQPQPPPYWSPPQGDAGQPPPPGYWSPPPGGDWQPTPPPGAGGPVPPRRRNTGVVVAVIAAGAVLLTGLGVGWGYATSRVIHSITSSSQSPIHTVPQVGSSRGPSSGASNGSSGLPAQSGQSNPIDVQAVSSKVSPAIVDINTTLASLGSNTAQAAGTGMILTSTGEILTNNHVVQQATSIKVTIQGHSGTYTARVLGVDPTADIALLQVDGLSGLPTVTLADSSTVTVGEQVVAMGNALGQGGAPSVTQGAVTALDQAITASSSGGNAEQLSGLIQMDATISEGDSGGAVANSAGQVIGLITAGQVQGFRQTSSTIGYAIPSSTAANIANEIQAGHASSTILIGPSGYLGVSVADLTPSAAARLGLSVSSGALVRGVQSGSPAAQIGITTNSVITAVDGTQISSSSDLGPAIQTHKPGQQIRVTWVDQSGTHTASATLTSGPVA